LHIMNRPGTSIGRSRAFLLFAVALVYAFLARVVAEHAARGLASGSDWRDPVGQAALVFLLLVGFVAMGRSMTQQRGPLADMGLMRRPGWGREFATGAGAGWGLMIAAILPSVFIGGLVVTFWTAAHQWLLLVIDGLVLLLAAFAQELVFRGYPFQRLIDAIGPGAATLLMSIIFTAVHWNPEAPRPAMLVTFLLSVLLSIAYLRTRALWAPWGFHFAWNAAMGLLFGLPVSGYTNLSPVVQTYALSSMSWTGGDYGPEGAGWTLLVVLAGLIVIHRVTRPYAVLYAQPVIVPGGIPVDIDAVARRQHEAAMGGAVPAATEPRLVQIAGVPIAQSPSSDENSGEPSESGPERP
jgi:membrane protease YdiL (CAAX protease family)